MGFHFFLLQTYTGICLHCYSLWHRNMVLISFSQCIFKRQCFPFEGTLKIIFHSKRRCRQLFNVSNLPYCEITSLLSNIQTNEALLVSLSFSVESRKYPWFMSCPVWLQCKRFHYGIWHIINCLKSEVTYTSGLTQKIGHSYLNLSWRMYWLEVLWGNNLTFLG